MSHTEQLKESQLLLDLQAEADQCEKEGSTGITDLLRSAIREIKNLRNQVSALNAAHPEEPISNVSAMLDRLRADRDKVPFSELRSAYNAACDRLDVLLSMLNHGEEELKQASVPVAWVVFAENGNSRIWFLDEQAAINWAKENDKLDYLVPLCRRNTNPKEQSPAQLPETPQDIKNFINNNFHSVEYKISEASPHEDDKYCLSAHDLLSAFYDLRDGLSAFSVQEALPASTQLTDEDILYAWDSLMGGVQNSFTTPQILAFVRSLSSASTQSTQEPNTAVKGKDHAE